MFGAGMTVDESISTSLFTKDFRTGNITFSGTSKVNVNGTFTNDNHKLRFDLGLSSEVTGTANGLLEFKNNGVSARITTQWKEQDSFFLRSQGTGAIIPSIYFSNGFNARYRYDVQTDGTNGVNGYVNLDFNYTSRQFDLLGCCSELARRLSGDVAANRRFPFRNIQTLRMFDNATFQLASQALFGSSRKAQHAETRAKQRASQGRVLSVDSMDGPRSF